MRISATIITLNEETDLGRALDSLQPIVDEIIVVDSGSTDATAQVAQSYAAKFLYHPWPGYAAQKNYAAAQAQHDWILSLDADECLSPVLQQAISQLKASTPTEAAYQFPRRNLYLGRWINHSGWYPDLKVRLYDRRRAFWAGEYVHESVQVEGSIGRLAGDLLHYSFRNLSEHVRAVDHYTTLAAQELRSQQRPVSLRHLLLGPTATFLKSYLLKQGFRDGWPGFYLAAFASYYVFLKYAKLAELNRSAADNGAVPD